MGLGRDEEVKFFRVVQLLLDQCRLHALGFELDSFGSLVGIELIAEPFQKQHSKDVFLELRSVHVAAQNITGFKELAL